jgi:hypothetical protein
MPPNAPGDSHLSLAFPAHILNAESEYGKGLLPHLQKEYGELGVNMAT